MGSLIHKMCLAGHVLLYRLRRPEAVRFLGGCMLPAEGEEYDIAVDDERFALGRNHMPERAEDYIEAKLLIALTSQSLLRFDACIFHSVAFVWRNRAWLLTGPSGVGKSTQFRRWNSLFGDEIDIISGDMPVLSTQPDGSIRVFPSAWNGKERWSGKRSAPLGGIILLKQAGENTIERLEPSRSVIPLLKQLVCVPDTESEIHAYAALADRLISNYPVWLLSNCGNEDAALLTKRTLTAWLLERSGE